MDEMGRRDKGTGGITQRKSTGAWQATWTWRDENDLKRVKTLTGKTKRIALNKIRDWVAGGGEEAPQGRKTLEQLLDHVIAGMRSRSEPDPVTINTYEAFGTNHIKPRIGKVALERLRPHHLDRVADEMIESGLSAKTARNCAVYLGQALHEGKRLGWLTKDLASDMKPVKIERYVASIYDIDQLATLIEACSENRSQPAVVISSLMGVREAECAALMWADIDFTENTMRIQRQNRGAKIKNKTKSAAGMRTIAMPEFVVEYLKALPKHSPFLMTSKDGKKPIHQSVIYHETMAAMDAAGLPKIRFHDLRHSANNILKQLGVPAETRRDILGHSTTAVTENVYTQTVDWEMREAMDKLQKAIQKRVG